MTNQENLTNIKLTDLETEAQQAMNHGVDRSWIEWDDRPEEHPDSLSVHIKRKHGDGRVSQWRQPMMLKRNESPKDVISRIEKKIISVYYKSHGGKDPANLEDNYPSGLFIEYTEDYTPGFSYGGETFTGAPVEDLWEFVDDKPPSKIPD